jgi:hypothetical protein
MGGHGATVGRTSPLEVNGELSKNQRRFQPAMVRMTFPVFCSVST